MTATSTLISGPHPSLISLTTMPPQTYPWISSWFLFTAPLMLWDAAYCLMRPRSMVGGDLHWIWKPYALYGEVDHVYGFEAFMNGDGFAGAAAVLNIIEITTNLIYLFYAYIMRSDLAPLFGYCGATMTLSKTLLYVLQEYFCNGCAIGHNDLMAALIFWILPNLLWVTFSALIMWRLGKDISVMISSGQSKKTR